MLPVANFSWCCSENGSLDFGQFIDVKYQLTHIKVYNIPTPLHKFYYFLISGTIVVQLYKGTQSGSFTVTVNNSKITYAGEDIFCDIFHHFWEN